MHTGASCTAAKPRWKDPFLPCSVGGVKLLSTMEKWSRRRKLAKVFLMKTSMWTNPFTLVASEMERNKSGNFKRNQSARNPSGESVRNQTVKNTPVKSVRKREPLRPIFKFKLRPDRNKWTPTIKEAV